MIQVFINTSLGIKINEYESIYNLKEYICNKTDIDIDDQMIYHHGQILKNNKCCKEYGIRDHDNLIMNRTINGGFDTMSILMWLIYLCVFMFYILIMASGLIPVVAHTYGYMLDWAIGAAGGLLGIGGNRYFKAAKYIIMFIVSIAIIYYFVYALTSFMSFPIVYAKTDKICDSIISSNNVGWWVALFFIIVYGLFNIPNFILNVGLEASNLNFIIGAIIQPVLGILENFANIGKFAAIYAIPFVGTPFLDGYHIAVGLIATAIKEGVDATELFSCNNLALKKKLGMALRSLTEKGSPLHDWVISYHAEKIIDSVIIGLIPELYNNYECKVNNMVFWQKFGNTAGKFYAAKYGSEGFCFALRLMQGIAGVLDNLGGSSQLANMIRTGNMGGLIGLIVFIICIILALFGII